MIQTVIAALLPVVITMCLGFFAGWHKDFNAEQGGVLNRMVMLYALPLALFASMMGIKRSVLLQQGDMALILLIGMVIGYAIVFAIARYIFRRSNGASALLAIAIAGPSIPFIGTPVLGYLYGDVGAIPVALGSIIMNLVQVPITLFLLARDTNQATASDPAGKPHQNSILDNIKHTVREPVVWAPILAFVLLLLDVGIPDHIRSALQLLGSTTGGVALFASGVILFSYHVVINLEVSIAVIAKNIILPAALLVMGSGMGIEGSTLAISIITMSIPTAAICVILAVQYKTSEQEMASILFISTILSVLTMGGFLYYLH